ncbi:MAG: heme lyase CcmF/NrfE family subunit [Anaerolineales bacterium]|nr:MAG: heme lyase CcmF/NrfE family subunit [Anaerolineales bacterium]
MANIGYVALLLALVLALYATVAALVGARRRMPELVMSARNAALTVTGLLTLSVVILEYLLILGDFRTLYVAEVSNRAMPVFFKMTALWGSQAGSLLFWSWLMSLFGGAVLLRKWGKMRTLMPYVIAVTQITLFFFISLISGIWTLLAVPLEALGLTSGAQLLADMVNINPFHQLGFTPADGNGLNPLLRHWGMIIHPPMLYLGFVSFVIPYAFAIAALVTRQTGDLWIRATRRWTLVAWLFLSMGLLLGGWWAYGVLGWGGYWAWDPVENAALMPWLTGTAFLHSVMIQEKRGMFKVWNMALIIMTYSLVIFGTFLTRSGVISSVHTFAQSGIGPLFLIFIGLMFIYSVILLFERLDSLKSENELDSLLSRESIFLLQNLLFLAVFFVTFWGTIFPVVSELVARQKAIVGPPFFNQVNGPLLAALVVLMGIAPLMPWRRASVQKLVRLLLWPVVVGLGVTAALFALGLRNFAILPGTQLRVLPVSLFYGFAAFTAVVTLLEYWRGTRARHRSTGEGYLRALWTLLGRNRRRYGGYLIHIGVIMMALGVIGTNFFQSETQRNLAVGESFTITSTLTGDYTLTYEGLRSLPAPDDVSRTGATLSVSRNGRNIGELHPTHDFFIPQEQPMTIPAMRYSLIEDLYVIVAGWEDGGATATFKAFVNPLVNWLWIGGFIFILGTAVAAWPDPAEDRRLALASAPRRTVPA